MLFQEKFYEWEKVLKVGGRMRKQAKVVISEPTLVSPTQRVASARRLPKEAEMESSVEDIMKEYNRTYSYADLVAGNYRDDIDRSKKEVLYILSLSLAVYRNEL